MEQENFDVLIIGAGIVGLSIGNSLLNASPNIKVLVVEKESSLGAHASGRNSGVLHAGFYYSPDSLKARFCREGNFELRTLCKEAGIPILECGKVVVTQNEDEESRLDLLFQRGVANGVDLDICEVNELSKYEPLAKTHRRFMWSPNTGVSDPLAVIQYLAKTFVSKGGKIDTAKEINLRTSSGAIHVKGAGGSVKHVVNASGAQADRIAKQVGVSNEYAMIPFMGVYREVKNSKLPLRTLIYPVPHPINPFLGVHFTLTLDGKVKIGPTAIPVLGREQYSLLSGLSLYDMAQALKGAKSLIGGDVHNFSEIVKGEWPKVLKREIVSQASNLVPRAAEVGGWSKKPPGIRAQLVHLPTGRLEQDFVVQNHLNSTHVLNAVSPGWTSALPFGRYVVEEFVLPKLS